MGQMTVVLEWREDLGPRWMNEDNLGRLLYTTDQVNNSVLIVKSVSFADDSPKERAQDEFNQLCQRMDQLGSLSYKDLMEMDEHDKCRLEDQYRAMFQYRTTLLARIESWDK